MNPSVSYRYRSGLEDVKLELPSPGGSGSAMACLMAPIEVPELTFKTHTVLCSFGHLLTASHARVKKRAAAAC